MNDKVHTVVGVLPPVPQYPDENDVYMATSACPFRTNKMHLEDRDMRMMEVFGRLKPASRWRKPVRTFPRSPRDSKPRIRSPYPENVGFTSVTNPLQEELTRSARPHIAAASRCRGLRVAHCLRQRRQPHAGAHGPPRKRNSPFVAPLGAGRSRLLRQLLTESFLMALAGGALGLFMAYGSLAVVDRFCGSAHSSR